MKQILLAPLLLSLVACGFQLRGSQTSGLAIDAVRLVTAEAYGDLALRLTRRLGEQGVAVNGGDAASLQLQLMNELFSRRAVSTTSQISVAEYELSLVVDILFADATGKPLTSPARLTSERIYSFNRDSFAASGEEERLLVKEMQDDIIQQILFRMEALVARPAETVDGNDA